MVTLRWALLAALGLVGGCGTSTDRGDAGNVSRACTARSDCAADEVCDRGTCVRGECVTRDDCSDPRDQLCSEFYRCVPDPSSTGTEPCWEDADCDVGEFCSAGDCYAAAERRSCLSDGHCDSDERCDVRMNYCVPLLGGCNRCADYVDVCCRPELVCEESTGRCRAS